MTARCTPQSLTQTQDVRPSGSFGRWHQSVQSRRDEPNREDHRLHGVLAVDHVLVLPSRDLHPAGARKLPRGPLHRTEDDDLYGPEASRENHFFGLVRGHAPIVPGVVTA